MQVQFYFLYVAILNISKTKRNPKMTAKVAFLSKYVLVRCSGNKPSLKAKEEAVEKYINHIPISNVSLNSILKLVYQLTVVI